MKIIFWISVLYLFGIAESSIIKDDAERASQHPDINLSIEQIVRKYGFPFEEHEIETKDGYLLAVHRIPHGRNGPPATPLGVVWLHHGLFSSSVDWIQNTVEKALGYDVWMANARGNRFSRRHKTLNPDTDSEFWRFSWAESGTFDFPALIDYALDITGEEQLFWVGHSMGGSIFFTGMITHPEYNSKIRAMFGFAPAIYLDHMTNGIRILAPIAHDIEKIAQWVGLDEFAPHSELNAMLGSTLCAETSKHQEICSNILFLIGGYNSEQLNMTQLPVILQHVPAGQSARSLVHYAQSINSKDFQRFDHREKGNLEMYGTDTPSSFNISKVTCPVALYSGANDVLVDPEDVRRTSLELSNLIGLFPVPHPQFTHLDFIWAIDADTLLYNPMIEIMKEY